MKSFRRTIAALALTAATLAVSGIVTIAAAGGGQWSG